LAKKKKHRGGRRNSENLAKIHFHLSGWDGEKKEGGGDNRPFIINKKQKKIQNHVSPAGGKTGGGIQQHALKKVGMIKKEEESARCEKRKKRKPARLSGKSRTLTSKERLVKLTKSVLLPNNPGEQGGPGGGKRVIKRAKYPVPGGA